MRLSRQSALALALLLGLLAVALVWFALRSRQPASKPAESVQIPVARETIPANTDLTPEMFEQKTVESDKVPKDVITDSKQLTDRITLHELPQGEPVSVSAIVKRSISKALAYGIPENYRALTVAVDDVSGVANFIRPGDYIDLVGLFIRTGPVVLVKEGVRVHTLADRDPAVAFRKPVVVAVNKVDALINLVGELVITQAMLRQRTEHLDPVANEALLSGLVQLERNTRDLQESVMGVRMLPVDFAFSRFPRMVRDLATRLDKKVVLRTHGEATELDKGVIEKIVDPLVHLVRNAIDHGLESPAERRAAGKDETGTLTLSAAHQGANILIEISDDGRGLDRERILRKAAERGIAVPDNPSDGQVWDLVFAPGFSTRDEATDLSGRGVGMDVVKKNIAALGGQVEIRSRPGEGTTVAIRLPLTMAIVDGMSVSAGGEVFIVPLAMVVESLLPAPGQVRTIAGEARVLRVREDYIPLVDLAAQYGLQPAERGEDAPPRIAVVVEADGRRLALEVDELLGQQQVVVKNLESNYKRVAGVSGATILGDGRVALIVDAGGLAQSAPVPAAA